MSELEEKKTTSGVFSCTKIVVQLKKQIVLDRLFFFVPFLSQIETFELLGTSFKKKGK